MRKKQIDNLYNNSPFQRKIVLCCNIFLFNLSAADLGSLAPKYSMEIAAQYFACACGGGGCDKIR